jgi:Fe-S oxidoreductase
MNSINIDLINEMLNEKHYMKEMLSACVSCGMCAESCFYYKNTGERRAIPHTKSVKLWVSYSEKREESAGLNLKQWQICYGDTAQCAASATVPWGLTSPG